MGYNLDGDGISFLNVYEFFLYNGNQIWFTVRNLNSSRTGNDVKVTIYLLLTPVNTSAIPIETVEPTVNEDDTSENQIGD